jgi:hypothetical protein
MRVRLHNFKEIPKGVGAPPLNSVESGKNRPKKIEGRRKKGINICCGEEDGTA